MRSVLVLTALWLAGCGGHGDHAVLRIAQRAQRATGSGGATSAPQLEGVRRVKAEGFPEISEFSVAARTSTLEKFPCLKCHSKPMEQLRRAQAGKKASHWEVKLVHAPERVMNCATCHMTEDLNSLATLNKTKISLDHAYAVCAQCHSRQAADWAGGAHGKRLGGWAPPRVVSSCVACHDPHRPKLEPRLPTLAERRPQR